MKRIFKAKVVKCKVVYNDTNAYNLAVAGLNGKDIEITIGRPVKRRSSPENRYYWAVPIKMLSDETGMSRDETHDALRLKFLRVQGKVETIRSTASLSVPEFEEYMSNIRRWASSFLDLYIPEPNEVEF